MKEKRLEILGILITTISVLSLLSFIGYNPSAIKIILRSTVPRMFCNYNFMISRLLVIVKKIIKIRIIIIGSTIRLIAQYYIIGMVTHCFINKYSIVRVIL